MLRLLAAVWIAFVGMLLAGGRDVAQGVRVGVGLLIGVLLIEWGFASLRPLQAGTKTYAEPVDVLEPEGVPVYSCKECGTQLVLLRRGSDKAPRHCGEAMTFTIVPESADLAG